MPELDVDVLLPSDGPRTPIADEVAALLSPNGTTNGLKMAIGQAGGCAICDFSYANLPSRTLPQVDNHLQVRQRKASPANLPRH